MTKSAIFGIITLLSLFMATNIFAVSASPDLIEKLKSSGQLQEYVQSMIEARAKGVFLPGPEAAAMKDQRALARSADPSAVDTFRVAVILCDFSDQPSTMNYDASNADFDQLLFSFNEFDAHYSMSEFYLDNSYGGFYLEGVVAGWYRLPQTYDYYVDGQKGFGTYPRSARRMAEDACLLADVDVDFSQFDNDGDGWCDGVFIVHSGPGYEQTGDVNDIHSHAWSMSYTLNLDGINVRSYTTEPEESSGGGLSTMGVYAHEYGHFLGLPDLYDTDYSSAGIGSWSLMAGGSWNLGGRYPAFMDAWCKKEVGFLTLQNVATSTSNIEFPNTNYNPVAYRLWANGSVGSQYFIVENRQREGNDPGLPGSGLVIYHIDESVGGNSDDNHRLVDVEQADGLFQLNLDGGGNSGDGGDCWSTETSNNFDDLTIPNTRMYSGVQTKTSVWDISAPDSVMYANLDVAYSRPSFQLQAAVFSDVEFGDGDGYPEAGETIILTFAMENLWLTANNVTATLTADNNELFFDIPSVNIGTIAGNGGNGGNSPANPIKFTVPVDFAPCIDSFYLDVTSDEQGDKTFGLQLIIGAPEILLVDDDNSTSIEDYYTAELYELAMPFDIYDKSVSGGPSAGLLNSYKTVIWFIGPARASILSAGDVTAMQSFLDGGGNLFLTGQSIAGQLDISDQSFLNNYLRATYDSDLFSPVHFGVGGTPIGDGLKLLYGPHHNQTEQQVISPINSSIMNYEIGGVGASTVTYDGTYKLVFMSFGFEALTNSYPATYATRTALFGEVLDFFNTDTVSLNPLINSVEVDGELSVLNIVNSTPTFFWLSSDTLGSAQVDFEIKVGTGLLCYNHDNMWAPAPFSGIDTSIVYSGDPLIPGESYVFQVRIYNGTSWSNWNDLSFRMNSAPVIGPLIAPKGDTLMTAATPPLTVYNAVDNENDVVTYNYEVYSDEALSTLVTSTSGYTEGGVSTTWNISPALAEDQRFFWRGRAFDGYEYSAYTDSGSFWVNAVNQAPAAFSLISPADNYVMSEGETITFEWQNSSDPDPTDVFFFTLQVSRDVTFAVVEHEVDYIQATTETPVISLATDTVYYWRVKAFDLQMAETWSTETFLLETPSTGCCIGIRGNVDNDLLDETNISDLTYLVDFMFRSGPDPICPEEANIIGDLPENVDITDLTALVDYLFRGGPPPAACP